MNKKGFTLVELLAVIAILAILVIVAVPNVIKLYSNSKKDLFVENVKTIYRMTETKLSFATFDYDSDLSFISSESGTNKLDFSGENIKYCITTDGEEVTSIKITDGSYYIEKYDNYKNITKENIYEGDFKNFDCSKTICDYINDSNCEKTAPKAYLAGDVDKDGQITLFDAILILEYCINIKEIDDDILKIGDVDNNGKLNSADASILLSLISGNIVIGDINMDGNIDTDDLNLLKDAISEKIILSSEKYTLADINRDSILSIKDVTLLINLISNQTKPDVTCNFLNGQGCTPQNYSTLLAGDVNKDGLISIRDISVLSSYIANPSTITDEILLIADLDKNEILNNDDITILQNILNETILIGDINKDKVVNQSDLDLLKQIITGTKTMIGDLHTIADVNRDCKINNKDINELSRTIANMPKKTLTQYNAGDVNKDGIISLFDAIELINIINNGDTITSELLLLGDLNNNKALENEDVLIILNLFKGTLKIGDINKDGKIDQVDYDILSDVISGKTILTGEQFTLADIYRDGIISVKDVSSFLTLRTD